MKHWIAHIITSLIVSVFSLSFCISQPIQSVDIAQILERPEIADAMLSPDGQWVFYTLKTPLWESNSWQKEVFILSLVNKEIQKLLNLDKGRDFQFSPNGRYISYLQDEGTGTQLWIQAFPKGKSFLLNYSPSPIKSYEWGKENLSLYFVNEKPDSILSNPYAFYAEEGANGRNPGNWDQLWEINITKKNPRPLLHQNLIIEEFDISPSNNLIAITGSTTHDIDQPQLKELYLLNRESLAFQALTNNQAPESAPLWSKDGQFLAFRAPARKHFKLSNGGFHIYHLEKDSIFSLKSQAMGQVDHIAWDSNNEGLFYNEKIRFSSIPYHINIYKDSVSSPMPLHTTGSYKALGYDTARTRMLYSFDNIQTPPELFIWDFQLQMYTQITQINQVSSNASNIPDIELIRYKSFGGVFIEGIYIPPSQDSIPSAPPLIVMLHGGPADNWGNAFSREWEFWNSQGYAIFAPNVRGSSGYGDPFLHLLKGDIGGGEFKDVMIGVDKLITEGKACEENLAILGWSWGGVLAAWSIAKSNRFKAAILGAPAVDWLAERGLGFTYDLQEWYIGSKASDDPDKWRRYSSITEINNIQTPTLIVHGELDMTHSPHQSRILFHGLKENKVPSRLLIFPEQGHQLNRPQETYSYFESSKEWLEKYLQK